MMPPPAPMSPLRSNDRGPTPNLGGAAGVASRSAAAVAVTVGLSTLAIGWRPELSQRVFLALGVLVALSIGAVGVARTRSGVLALVGLAAVLFLGGLLGPKRAEGVPAVVLFAVQLAAGIATLSFLNEESSADWSTLAAMPNAPHGAPVRRSLPAAVLAIGALCLLVALVLPSVHLPKSKPPAEGGGRPRDGKGSTKTTSGRNGGRSTDPRGNGPLHPVEDDQYGVQRTPDGRGTVADAPVMMVKASESALWRGNSFDKWTGNVWQRTIAVSKESQDASTGLLIDNSEAVKGRPFVQTITVLRDGANVVFGALQPVRVQATKPVLPASDGTIAFAYLLVAGDTYQVESVLRTASDATLDAVAAQADSPEEVKRLYSAASAAVATLASATITPVNSARQRVVALEAWMVSNLHVGTLPSTEKDPVKRVLDTGAGTPDQLATVAVLALRSAGTPARLVTGYQTGRFLYSANAWEVRSSDAWVWLEYYVVGYGWLESNIVAKIPLLPVGATAPTTAKPSSRQLHVPGWVLPLVLSIGALVLVSVWARWFFARRKARLDRPWPQMMLESLGDEGTKRGSPRARGTPVDRYSADLGAGLLADRELVGVGAVISREAYSPHPPDLAARAWAEATFAGAIAATEKREKVARGERRARRWQQFHPRRWFRRGKAPTVSSYDPDTRGGSPPPAPR